MKLVTSAQMRDLEAGAAAAGVSVDRLMENAGLATAQEVWMQLGQVAERKVLVLVGPGHNGGDGLVAARHLREWQADVHCYALKPRDDPQWQRNVAAGIPCASVAEDPGFQRLETWLNGAELVIDALLGTGAARPIGGDLAEILTRLRAARARSGRPRLIAVDLPTGLDADSGQVDPLTAPPDETVTFQYAKVGHYTQPGAAMVGELQVIDIGIPAELERALPFELFERREAKALLPARPPAANKGTFGKVLVIAGSSRYPGAAILAASAAYRVGAGLVTLATAGSLVRSVVTAMPEVTYLPLPERMGPGILDIDSLVPVRGALRDYDALVLGCGLGQEPVTQVFIRTLLEDRALGGLKGVVIDADGLNALRSVEWASRLSAPFVVTPHPGELSRLIGGSVESIQTSRLDTAVTQARLWGGVVVLKGANTVVAEAEGRVRLSAVATAALATAGTGDVLAGAIGGLLAQGLSPFDAAALAVYLHGNAGERAAKAVGKAGTTAGDVLQQLAPAGRALAGEEPLEGGGLGFPGTALGSLGRMGAGELGAALER